MHMHIFAYPDLLLTSSTIPVLGQLRRLFTASLAFSLKPSEAGRVLPAQDGWTACLASLEEGLSPDLGVPKPQAEWLMAGSACAPRGTQVQGLPVDVSVGVLHRSFMVSGECRAGGIQPAPPEPFAEMPLDWKHAYGGEGLPENPRGRGFAQSPGSILPCVHEKSSVAVLTEPQPVPVCPSAMHLDARRFARPGTFDQAWLGRRWPGPPDDFDWSWYSLAQPSQRQAAPFTGLETVSITNMHPDYARLEGRLPGLRLRLFLDYGTPETPDWREVQAQADTVWLFPNQLCGLVLWHASAPTADERSFDILRVAACLEPADQAPQDASGLIAQAIAFQQEVQEPEEATHPAEEPEEAPEEAPAAVQAPSMAPPPPPPAPPVPKAPEPPRPETPEETCARIASEAKKDVPELTEEANKVLKSMGMGPIDPRQVEAQIDRQTQQMLSAMKKSQPDFHKTMALAGYTPEQADRLVEASLMTPPSPQAFPSPLEYDKALARYADRFAELTGASKDQCSALIGRLRHIDALEAEQAALAKNAAALEETIPQASLDILAKAGFKADPKAYGAALDGLAGSGRSDAELLGSITKLGTALGLDPGAMKGAMAKVFGAVRTQAYTTPDVQGALTLAGAGFPAQQGAMDRLQALVKSPPQGELYDLASLARKAGVSDPRLISLIEAADPLPMGKPEAPKPQAPEPKAPEPEEPAAATEAEPAPEAALEAPLPEAEEPAPEAPPLLDGQHLAGANLAGLALAGAQLAGADLTGADLSGSDLEGADFSGAKLQGARLAGAKLDACDFTEADLTGADLSGARAHDAVFDRAVFLGTAVQGLDARSSRFSGTLFTEQELAGASLREAVLSQTRLENRVLAGCDLTGASLEEVWLDGCDFEQGQLGMARFDRCSVSGTSFRHANLAGSSWTRTRGVKADFRNALLANALFEECTFTMTRFTCMSARGCRMLSCDLWGSDLKRADMLGGALRGTKLGKCDLTEASLFDADLYLAGIDSETSFSGANLTRTCLALGEKP
jgi:uncharacterized protein YjbI with pentapeptide repeats